MHKEACSDYQIAEKEHQSFKVIGSSVLQKEERLTGKIMFNSRKPCKLKFNHNPRSEAKNKGSRRRRKKRHDISLTGSSPYSRLEEISTF